MSHAFNFPGGEELTKIGASWFVSYWYGLKNPTHQNWKKVGTHPTRANVFKSTTGYHNDWLKEIAKMNEDKLDTNEIGLTGVAVKKLAKMLP